jgi:hypothetical protein
MGNKAKQVIIIDDNSDVINDSNTSLDIPKDTETLLEETCDDGSSGSNDSNELKDK